MNKLWILVLFPFQLLAQGTAGPEADFAYDLTYDFLIPTESVDGLSQQWYSNGHSFSFMGEWALADGVGIGYGFGFSVHNLHNNLAFVQVESSVGSGGILTLPSDSAFNINEQNLGYFDIPFEFRYRGRSFQSGRFFRMSVGAKVGYRFYAAAYHRDGDNAIRQYRVFDTSPWRVKAYGRIGIGKLTLYAGYDLIPTLEEQYPGTVVGIFEPIQFHMMSVGVSLVL